MAPAGSPDKLPVLEQDVGGQIQALTVDTYDWVTKESGEAGGFPEKAEAASLCGAELLTLRRPAEIGKPLTQIEHLLETEIK